MVTRKSCSILIINPNTTKSMTDGLRPLVEGFYHPDTRFEYFTAPAGVPSINDEDDAAVSAEACLPALEPRLAAFDAFLVCCYSHHPLTLQLREKLRAHNHGRKPVAGIFEASVAVCLQSIDISSKFGIVSTGKQWEDILGEAVADLLGSASTTRYAGTETTGLNASELHTTPKAEVDLRMKDATKRLLRRGAKAICLGCAGMAGMNRTVREACIEQLGAEGGEEIKIVDGVVSGVNFLEGAWRTSM